LLNASVGVQRVLGLLRRTSLDSIPAMTLPARPRIMPRSHRMRIASRATSTHLHPMARRRRRRWAMWFRLPSIGSLRVSWRSFRSLRSLRAVPLRRAFTALGHERVIGISVAGIVLAASFLSVSPGRANGDTGGPNGDGSAPRLAVGGSGDGDDVGSVEEAYVRPVPRSTDGPGTYANEQPQGVAPTEASIEGPFLDDGTLLKPVAVNTSVPDGSSLMRTYKVKSGDTLATIASHFDVSTMTVWWANDLKAKNRLVVGQELLIPPVSGLVIEVRATDTLASLTQKYKLTEDEILSTNGLTDRHLVVGQVLMLPGARGAGIVAPKSRTATSSGPRRSGSSSSVRAPRTYNGGHFAWPTTSHHISQYYHYGHYAIDIDGNTGDPIWAAASGTVIFAGWKNNGGGYQVWISHGSNLYTTYNHMSSVAVGRGQSVGRGQRVGRMGSTGYATGSHLHFEVWKGPVWNGGVRVNPLAYL
jgi:murein DD-endopeptidase MepM/ murein hydrolase activator NlpD